VKAPESGRRGAVLLVFLSSCIACMAMPSLSLAGVVDFNGTDVSYVANPGELNNITVDLAGGVYTVTDTAGVTPAVGSPCTLTSPTSATCPQSAPPTVDHLGIYAGDMDDTITVNAVPRDGTRIDAAAGNDTVIGSPGADKIFGGPGNDVIDPTDVGAVDLDIFNSFDTPCDTDPILTDVSMFHCPDLIDGGSGFNTLQFNGSRLASGGVVINSTSRGPLGTAVSDPTREQNGDVQANVLVKGIRGNFRTAKLVGTPVHDEIIGSIYNDTIIGRGGADLLCGSQGNDTVDYSGSDSFVNVTLNTNLVADTRWESTNRDEWIKARSDCRQTDNLGNVMPAAEKDCVADDGKPGEGDCVGVDVENVIGSAGPDTLIGNAPGAYIAKAAFFEPRGMNVLDGRGGNDSLDGRGGADVLIGGADADTVTYATYSQAVKVSLDGAANDGGSPDLNPDTGLSDSVGPDVENLIGGSGDDTLGGSSANNTLLGGAGSDTLSGEG
jgi:Ca2+-binding RTX toxin-like protein